MTAKTELLPKNIIETDAIGTVSSRLAQLVAQNQIPACSVGKYRGDDASLKRVSARLIQLKGRPHLQLVFHHQQNDITRNYLFDSSSSVARVLTLLNETGFRDFRFETPEVLCALTFNKKNEPVASIKNRSGTHVTPLQLDENDRSKQRFLNLTSPYLKHLGITDGQAQIIPAMSRKWKQVNRFVDIFSGALAETSAALQSSPLQVADFGAGRGYLTFGIADYLADQNISAQVTGYELRPALVEEVNQIARLTDMTNLAFKAEDIAGFSQSNNGMLLNVMIALHACDTATDHAIFQGIQLGAELIMVSPCCHKEVRPQISPPAALAPALKFGLQLGQEAEMVTDTVRAGLLEACGYRTRMVEFVSLEHTAKNKLIVATRKVPAETGPAVVVDAAALEKMAEYLRFYGVQQQMLLSLLQKRFISNSSAMGLLPEGQGSECDASKSEEDKK